MHVYRFEHQGPIALLKTTLNTISELCSTASQHRRCKDVELVVNGDRHQRQVFIKSLNQTSEICHLVAGPRQIAFRHRSAHVTTSDRV